jgi:hypothetical protein
MKKDRALQSTVEQLTHNEQVDGSSPLVGSHEVPAKRRKISSPDFALGLHFR